MRPATKQVTVVEARLSEHPPKATVRQTVVRAFRLKASGNTAIGALYLKERKRYDSGETEQAVSTAYYVSHMSELSPRWAPSPARSCRPGRMVVRAARKEVHDAVFDVPAQIKRRAPIR